MQKFNASFLKFDVGRHSICIWFEFDGKEDR